MRSLLKYPVKAVTVFAVLTIIMTFVWDAMFPGRIYHCTDHVGLDYLHPGDWVHGDLEIVEDVASASSRTMGERDIMLRGWTTGRLWLVWGLMFGSSLIVSCLFAGMRWPIPESSILNQEDHDAP